MFETLVTGLLTSALGSYIDPKCFSSDKINVAVWSGYVVLTELEVKPEVVAGLPAVKLVRGLVGSIELKIPWNRLQSDSVVATVDDVYLLLRTEEDVDAVMRQMDEFTLKKKLLEELYAQAKQQEDAATQTTSSEDGFAARLVNKIIDNVELHIRRIHIRLEDYSTGDHPFSVGMTIESVHVQSTNSNWQPSYVDTSISHEPRIYKILELNHLSVYCDPEGELQRGSNINFETCSAETFSSAFSRAIPKRFDDRRFHHMQLYPSPQQHHFLLKPVDASARLIVNRDVFDASVPKFEIDVKVPEVAFRLEESQYCDMLYLISALQAPDYYMKYRRYRESRPQMAVLDEPAEWWKYAITSVIKDVKTKKQQWAWGFMKDRREDRKRYVSLWQQKSRRLLELADVDYEDFDSEYDEDEKEGIMENADHAGQNTSSLDLSDTPISPPLDMNLGLEEIERRRSVEDVLFFRYLADLEVRKILATRASPVRRRLPTPPTRGTKAYSDTESVDTECTESSVPSEVQYRSWGAWMFGWTSKLATPSSGEESARAAHRIIPEVELRELFKILEEPCRRSKKRTYKNRDARGQCDVSLGESQTELAEVYRITVTLQWGSVTLASDPEMSQTLLRDDVSYGQKYAPTDFLLGTFSQLQIAAVARCETVVVDISLQSIEAFDESAESSAFSRLLSRKQNIRSVGDGDDVNVSKLSGVVFLMSYEMNPVRSGADASLFVHMEPLEVVLSPTAQCWGRLARFMDTPADLGLWEELEVASFNDIVNLKMRTEAKLGYVMENRIALAVDLRIQAPVIIIPQSDTDYNCARLVIDLGRITFRTERLSQMDSESMSTHSRSDLSRGRSEQGTLALRSPSHYQAAQPNTSFVQQLYDEAERGEGAIRWKEDFYDKFSLSVANIHVLLVPYGKTTQVQDTSAGYNGINVPLPPYLTDTYSEEYELIERLNINVIVRMSILPLDATLTRFYIHADLPAFTVKLSLEKYHHLMAMGDRFNLADAETRRKPRKYSDDGLHLTEDVFGSYAVDVAESGDRSDALTTESVRSASAFKKLVLDSGGTSASETGVLPDNLGDFGDNSSVESDDTWFSFTSGNMGTTSASSVSGDAGERKQSFPVTDSSDTVEVDDKKNVNGSPRVQRRARTRRRSYAGGETANLLDRRLVVCSFTVPLISVQLKKPRSSAISSYASYCYDVGDFDDGHVDSGTILMKLHDFRVRVGQRTMSTRVNVGLTSFEVVESIDGRSTQYLLFSSPTIAAPFSAAAPLRRGGNFSEFSAQHRRRNLKRERVISFHNSSAKNKDASRSETFASPETLLELGFSTYNDQQSGEEVLREVDLQLGSVQLNFDQSYVCSLFQLFDDPATRLAMVHVPPRGDTGSIDGTEINTDGCLLPPLELSPTIAQEYSVPVNLTESVRADLEQARKTLCQEGRDAKKTAMDRESEHVPVALKLSVQLHSISVCFSDRGESVASIAVLDTAVQVGTGVKDHISISGTVGDVKVFDLLSMKRQEDGTAVGNPEHGFGSSAMDHVEIFGLDTTAACAANETRHILSIKCLICTEMKGKSKAIANNDEQVHRKDKESSLEVTVQPVRLLARPEFVESLSNYVVDGCLLAHVHSDSVHSSEDSFTSEFQLAPRSPPDVDCPPSSLTPFFDAIETSNRQTRQFSAETPNILTPTHEDHGDYRTSNQGQQSNHGNRFDAENDAAAILAYIYDSFDLDIQLCHPCVVLPTASFNDTQASLGPHLYRGIEVDFGTISIALQRDVSDGVLDRSGCTRLQASMTVDGLQVISQPDRAVILNRSGFQVRGSIPRQPTDLGTGNDDKESASIEIAIDVNVSPVRVNVSEACICLGLDVFYAAIDPISRTVRRVVYRIENYESASVISGGQDGHDGGFRYVVPGPNLDMVREWHFLFHVFLQEFTIALVSNSVAPHQLEMWMKGVDNAFDEASSRESCDGASSATQWQPRPENITGRRINSANEISSCVVSEFTLMMLEANVAVNTKSARSSDSQLQCEFILHEVVIRDKIADSSEHFTQLLGPVPEALPECTEPYVSDLSSKIALFPFSPGKKILPPLPRDSSPHSSGPAVPSSQLSGRLTSKIVNVDESAIRASSLYLDVSSARLMLLPRTILQVEQFSLDVYLAVSMKTGELELQRDKSMAAKSRGVKDSSFVDAGTSLSNNTPSSFRPRNDSKSEPFEDAHSAVRSAFASPLQRMLGSTGAAESRNPGSFASRAIAEKSGTMMSVGDDNLVNMTNIGVARKVLTMPRWKVDARFSNLQMWVVPSDYKNDVTGCVLSCQVVVKFDSASSGPEESASSRCNDLVAASVRLNNVEMSMGLPTVIGTERQRPMHHTGTLVEKFEVDVQFALRQCFRPVQEDETADPEGVDEKSDGKSDTSTTVEDNVKSNDGKARLGPWFNIRSIRKDDNPTPPPTPFLRDVPSEWQEWVVSEPLVCIDQIVSHVTYRDLPLLLNIAAWLTNMLAIEERIRDTFDTKLRAATDGIDWVTSPSTAEHHSEYVDYPETDGESDHAEQAELSALQLDVLTRASIKVRGVQFQLINNIADQASPVVEFDLKPIEMLLRSESNSTTEVSISCRIEAKYQNLRLVTMEPLIEPWSAEVTLCQQLSRSRDLDDREQLASSPWKLDITSDAFLQLNLTDALIANLVAADRAWRWVAKPGKDSREMTEYSTYWIRNNTGMPLRYWGQSCCEHSLAAGEEEPLRLDEEQSKGNGGKRRRGGRCNGQGHDRQIFIAVEEEFLDGSLLGIPRQWKSEASIPVDQVDSRMYALVDSEAGITATSMRKCECVIDVLVERGCKYFVVRSTLILENQTSSDLEVEFVLPERHASPPSSSTDKALQGHTMPIWNKVVKASSAVPVPVHIVSSGGGYLMVRPPAIIGANAGEDVLPRAYAKERVHLPVFDTSIPSADEDIRHVNTNEPGQSQCTIKFQRLYSDRPVRPFMMNACLSSASSVLYYRTLSFHPPLIVHNLTAGPLDFCLATPSDWLPAAKQVIAPNTAVNASWESCEQRLCERDTIDVADSLLWHLSSEETPLVLSIRMKGFDWSEPLELDEELDDLVRMKMKDIVSDALLYVTIENRRSRGHCRELFLYVPYWIVNLTNLKLEFEYEKERMGREHRTTLLAGQTRLDRDELLLKETQRSKTPRQGHNAHLLYPVLAGESKCADESEDLGQQHSSTNYRAPPFLRGSERKRRRPRLLPSVLPVKGLLDLLPTTNKYDLRDTGHVEVLQACHSNYRKDRGCVRLRVSNESVTAGLDTRKEHGHRKWSDYFVLELAGTIGEIEADDYEANQKFSIGYSISQAEGQYSRTKVIMLTPRFMLINTLDIAIEVCHSSSKTMTPTMTDMADGSGSSHNSRVASSMTPVIQLDAGAYAHFHWTLRFAKTRTIRCRFVDDGWSWSGAVPLVESGEYAVRMRHESLRDSKLVRVTLKMDSSCVCVYFREELTTAPPFRVENYSLETLRTHQHRVRRSEILLPHHSLDYAWDEPTEERLLVVDMLPSAAGDNSRPLRIGSFDLDKIQRYPDSLGGTLGIEVSTDGPTRVLRFTDTRLRGEKTLAMRSHNANDLATRTDASGTTGMEFLRRFVTAPMVHVVLHLQGVGISIVDSAPKELIYMSISGITLNVLVSENDRADGSAAVAGNGASLSRLQRETRPRILACCFEVSDVQVDNQLQMTPHPVLLRFSHVNGRSRRINGQGTNIPALQISLVKHDEYAGIEFIRHLSVKALPVHIRVDGALLYRILPLLVHAKVLGSNGNAGTAIKRQAGVVNYGESKSGERIRAVHSRLLLRDLNASLEVPVKVLEAAQNDGVVSAESNTRSTASATKALARRNSVRRQQLLSPRHKHHTTPAAEVHRYSAFKHGSLSAIATNDEQKKLYFEEFHIDPIHAMVSFSFGDSAGAIVDGNLSPLPYAAASTDPSSARESSVVTVGPLRLILSAIGTSLTKVANAPFRLKALHIRNSFVQPDALATRLASHYQSEALRQAYVILGSVDVLGNPMIAWKNLRGGFREFISEPAHGLSQRSPQAFAFGVWRGSLSLVRTSVYTFLDFHTRILKAFSLGLSEACLKLDDYTGYPATRHIFQGLVQGVSGMVVAPIHSFEENGAQGILPGLVAGVFGVVLKPLLGISLAVSTTAATLRDAVDPNIKAVLVHVRPPRHIDLRTKKLKVYSYVESLGEEIVGKIRGGRYRGDGYLGHVDLKATHQSVLVTRKRVLFLTVKDAASTQTAKYDVVWELLAEEIVMVDCSRTSNEQAVKIYYMEDEFRAAGGAGLNSRGATGSTAVTSNRQRTLRVSRGMFLQKHEVALPETKVLFFRAMLQQQERSLLTKMNSSDTEDRSLHHSVPMPPLTRSSSMELGPTWQAQYSCMPPQYPIFRLPRTLHQSRSSANLAQALHAHNNYSQQRTPTRTKGGLHATKT
ncbi:unnamed protein product [Hyaloperonospora brassicae]|uniref:Vacuolar protein sorting-associated protein n=1 Tax=Hyaloperonospora brassicae TaxID=162125 RepID=A0AAV0U218_HYABA|nr:unnamed protein product [Hyaloperonospora brassicae]